LLVYKKKCSFQISQQPENCENSNDPDLVQAFLKKWWVESDFKAPILPLSLRLKVSDFLLGQGLNEKTKQQKTPEKPPKHSKKGSRKTV
jgi:hypothetical protein